MEVPSACQVCWENPTGTISRCSVCKNRYYCRPACQRKDWKKHKLNCSLRPDGPLPPANFEDTEELDSEVDRVKQIVKSVYDEWKDLGLDKLGGGGDPKPSEEDKAARKKTPAVKYLSQLELLPAYAYTTSHDIPPLKKTIIPIIRLYLLYDIAHKAPAELDATKKKIESLQMPSDYAQLDASKILARPGDLSPGEYAMLLTMSPVLFAGLLEEVMTDEHALPADKWMALLAVREGLL